MHRKRSLRFLAAAALGILGFLGAGAQTGPERTVDRLILTLPDLPWALVIAEPGFAIKEKRLNPGGDGIMLMAVNSRTQVNLSAFIEKAAGKGDAKACREFYWRRMQKAGGMTNVRMSESGQAAVAAYDFAAEGMAQKNAHAYLAMGGYWIDVHLSKISLGPEAGDPFGSILEHITIDGAYVPTPQEHLGYASYYYLKKDYAKAAAHYEHVIDRASAQTTLPRDLWRVVADQLGMSYGLSGEAGKAKELFEWAISKDPEYPLFYYNLACACAELGDPEAALRNLRLAYQTKGNLSPKESLPDPKKDPSFKKYLKNKDFAAELDKMK